jgi:diguanylate cyclase
MQTKTSENNYESTVDIVRDAIPRMSALKIPITPNNYAVWYEYLRDTNEALRAEMDALLANGRPITNAEMRALYERYLEERDEKLQLAKTALGQVLAALMDHINRADGHYGSFNAELGEIAGRLSTGTSTTDLNEIVDRAMSATRAALERGAELRQQFSTLAAEMQQVRSALARSHEEARTDALTGVYNRLAFQEELDDLAKTASDDTHPPCLIMVDVDHFKQINDTCGHLGGDHALRTIAHEIRDCVRGRDMVVRYGGEEFAVLLRDTPRSGCKAVAENLRATIERSPIRLPEELGPGRTLSVTVSLGGAWLREQEAVEAFVDRADRALYRSKQDGRNRVTWEGK